MKGGPYETNRRPYKTTKLKVVLITQIGVLIKPQNERWTLTTQIGGS